MTNYGEMLFIALNERNKSIKDLENNNILALNTFYIYNKTAPSLQTMIKIANYLKMSIDYILEKSTENNFKKYKSNQSKFFNNLERVRIQLGISKQKLCNDLGISRTNFSRWKRGTNPSISKLIDLSNYLGCDIDELLEREK